MNRTLLFLFFCSAFARQLSAAPAEAEAASWLERMNDAVLRLSYEGYFVYLSGRSLEAMRIRHRIVDGQPRESLYSLNGVPREVIRDAETLTIITRANGRERRIRQPSTEKFAPMKPLRPEEVARHYRLVMGGVGRIADRHGVVVRLVPKDDLRYGYRLTLDRESALPLDLTVLNGSELVSRIMFTHLSVGDGQPAVPGGERITRGAGPVPVKASSPASGGGKPPVTDNAPGGAQAPSRWRFEGLPAGFELVSHRLHAGGRQEHFIFSDGVATVSAYLEPVDEGDRRFSGEATLGSINAFGMPVAGQQLTVVGEVPHRTLRLVAGALKQRQP